MTEKILLRTMTLKSKFTEGKFEGKTVDEVMNNYNNKRYVAWVYFCIQNISFTDDILNSMGISGRWVINKPGIDRKGFDEYKRNGFGIMFKKIKEAGEITKRSKMAIKEHNAYKKGRIKQAFNSVSFTKAQLQSINHGRKI